MGRKIGSAIGLIVFAVAGFYTFTQSKTDNSIIEVHNKMIEIESATFDLYEATADRPAQAALLEDGANKLRALEVSSLPKDYQGAFKRLAEAYSQAAAVHKGTPVDEAKVQTSLEKLDKAKADLLKLTDAREGIEVTD
ncbi:MAG: hypothetical protein MUC50_05855 [Myxococcota bacterium]|jgi:predicted RNA-binding protein with PIN domain|nr:hypothetical protein [Myxococcota bacterium]